MDETNISLLREAGQDAPTAWARLDRVYRPFLNHWFRARGIRGPEVEDLVQEVMVVLFNQVKVFDHSGRTGAFRTWLRNICNNRLLDHLRRQRLRGGPVGGTDFQVSVNNLQEADDSVADFDQQYEHTILRQLFEELSSEFSESTMQAFRRTSFDNLPAAQVAIELKLSVGAVYIARSRVLRRLRELAAGLIDDTAI